jgi:hypothetical protein
MTDSNEIGFVTHLCVMSLLPNTAIKRVGAERGLVSSRRAAVLRVAAVAAVAMNHHGRGQIEVASRMCYGVPLRCHSAATRPPSVGTR